ncbi:hypothetical protein OGV36_18585 [Citrobacter sp. Cb008]|uniref:hypothetical protein n=1 Tax=Citrobacter TaxID=544 RepID=UPI0013782938|nr:MULTISPECIES: hypothetical protein [Citrobacter]NCL82522.1 hypothetical protein [Citrobacter braakii]NUD12797.1 hypothetical protein [Escherichia coli]MBA8104640.1 hypothetical protein [Citrobacter sp. RHBSTW-00029]MBU3802218.1 hypothetical protein [Citrobacter youngae]MDM3365382.1 hypothetical protein [Citrobacter sp. Cb005]
MLYTKQKALPTQVPALHESLCLANDSPSGIRYRVSSSLGVHVPTCVAGLPTVISSWPPDVAETFRGQHLHPLDYEVSVQTGWDIQEIGEGLWDVNPLLETFPAAEVRAALKHLELEREIQLLTRIVETDKEQVQKKDVKKVSRFNGRSAD